MPRVPDLPCADCGQMMWRSKTSAPEGAARCRPCRRALIPHGTVTGYGKRGCRCDECRAAVAQAMRVYSAKVKARDGASPTQKYRPAARLSCLGCGKVLAGGWKNAEPQCGRCRPRGRGDYVTKKVRLSIYERDGWTCQLCMEPVDKTAHFLTDWAPTLDHIVCQSWEVEPDHSPSNLRLAHRWCNTVRGDERKYTSADLIA